MSLLLSRKNNGGHCLFLMRVFALTMEQLFNTFVTLLKTHLRFTPHDFPSHTIIRNFCSSEIDSQVTKYIVRGQLSSCIQHC